MLLRLPNNNQKPEQNQTAPSKDLDEIRTPSLSPEAKQYLTPDLLQLVDQLIRFAVDNPDSGSTARLEAVSYALYTSVNQQLTRLSGELSETDKQITDLEHYVVLKATGNIGKIPIENPKEELEKTLVARRFLKDTTDMVYRLNGKLYSVVLSIQGMSTRLYNSRSNRYRSLVGTQAMEEELKEETTDE